MKTSELTGAQLDYWTARAEGIPAENLRIQPIQRSANTHCVRTVRMVMLGPAQSDARDVPAEVLRYSTDWAQGGPLIEEYGLAIEPCPPAWWANEPDSPAVMGDTPLIAICRAVVRAAFGDEVEEVAVCP